MPPMVGVQKRVRLKMRPGGVDCGAVHLRATGPVARRGRKHRLMTPSLALRGALASRIDGGRYEVSPCLPLHREIKELQLCSAHRCEEWPCQSDRLPLL